MTIKNFTWIEQFVRSLMIPYLVPAIIENTKCIKFVLEKLKKWSIHPSENLSIVSPFHDLMAENKQRRLIMYNIGRKMIIGFKFNFVIFCHSDFKISNSEF